MCKGGLCAVPSRPVASRHSLELQRYRHTMEGDDYERFDFEFEFEADGEAKEGEGEKGVGVGVGTSQALARAQDLSTKQAPQEQPKACSKEEKKEKTPVAPASPFSIIKRMDKQDAKKVEEGSAFASGGLWRWGAEEKRAMERFQNATVRGAGIGLILRGGFVSFSALTSLIMGKKKKHGTKNAVSVLRWTAFLGSMGGSYVALDELLLRLVGKKKSNKWRGLVSGALAGSSICFLGKSEPQYAISIYVFLRAMWLFLRRSRRSTSKFLRAMSLPLETKNADVLVMCLSCTQILYAWLQEPRTLPIAYKKFLDKHNGKPEWVIESIRQMVRHNTNKSGPVKYQSWHPLVPKEQSYLKKARTPYGLVLQGQYQLLHHVAFFFREYKRKIPIYIPVYFLPALIVHRWKLLTKPKLFRSVLYKSVLGTLQSALFLTSFCTLAWTFTMGGAYLAAPVLGKEGLNGKWLATCLSPIGMSLLCEKKSRRKEIAVYCSARAFESFALCALMWGWIPKRLQFRRFDVVLFSIGTGLIMHCYNDSNGDYRYTFRSKYLNVIDFVFGNHGHKHQKIRHIPSTTDLAGSVYKRIKSLRKSEK